MQGLGKLWIESLSRSLASGLKVESPRVETACAWRLGVISGRGDAGKFRV